MSSTAVRMWSNAYSTNTETRLQQVEPLLAEAGAVVVSRGGRAHPLMDLFIDGRFPVGGTRNFEPLHQRFDG